VEFSVLVLEREVRALVDMVAVINTCAYNG